MLDYLVVWRALPKLLMGLIFIIYCYILAYGTNAAEAASWWAGLAAYLPGWPLLIAALVLLLLLSVLGLTALGIIEIGVGTILATAVPRLARRASWLSPELVALPEEIALNALKGDPSLYSRFFYLKNLATLQLEKKDELQLFMRDVEGFVARLSSAETLHDLNYYTMLAQDRRALEIAHDEIRTFWHLLTLLALTALLLFMLGGLANGIVGLLAITIVAFGILREITRRKRQISLMLIGGFMDIFSIGEGAEIADRPGEPLI